MKYPSLEDPPTLMNPPRATAAAVRVILRDAGVLCGHKRGFRATGASGNVKLVWGGSAATVPVAKAVAALERHGLLMDSSGSGCRTFVVRGSGPRRNPRVGSLPKTKFKGRGPKASTRLRSAISGNEALAQRLLSLVEDPDLEGKQITTSHSAYMAFKPSIVGLNQEALVVIALNKQRKVLAIDYLTLGNDGFTIVDPKQIFRWALAQGRSGASAIIMGHNHPSGSKRPSRPDIDVTERVSKAGRVLGVPLLDHLVLTDNGYTSLAEEGYITQSVSAAPLMR